MLAVFEVAQVDAPSINVCAPCQPAQSIFAETGNGFNCATCGRGLRCLNPDCVPSSNRAMRPEQSDEWTLNWRQMQLEGLQSLSNAAPTRVSAIQR